MDKSAAAFVNQLDQDPDLQKKVKECVLAEQHIAAMAKLLGFDFTPEELDQALLDKWGAHVYQPLLLRVTFSERPGF